MKVTDILRFARERGEPVFSFEFFPPRTDEGERQLFLTVEALRPLGPGFVSVTYGAGGSERARTVDLVKRLKRDVEVEPVAHVTCVGSPRDEVARVLDDVAAAGIQNVLLLRGDPPRGEKTFVPHPDGFAHASDLVAFVRSRPERWGFCVGAAAYPEGHPETRDLARDLAHLKVKVDAGVDFLVTQLFFENSHYFRFVERARAAGMSLPVMPGVMPFTSVDQNRALHRDVRRLHPSAAAGGHGGAADRCRGLAPAGGGLRQPPVRRPAPPGRAGHPLLHAQPVAQLPGDPGRAPGQHALARRGLIRARRRPGRPGRAAPGPSPGRR